MHAFVYQRGSTRREATRHGRDPTTEQPIRARTRSRRRGVKSGSCRLLRLHLDDVRSSLMTEREGNASLVLISR